MWIERMFSVVCFGFLAFWYIVSKTESFLHAMIVVTVLLTIYLVQEKVFSGRIRDSLMVICMLAVLQYGTVFAKQTVNVPIVQRVGTCIKMPPDSLMCDFGEGPVEIHGVSFK